MVADLTSVKNNWIYQSNRLIESSYTLTVTEQKLLRILASMIKKDDQDFKEYEFKTKDLQKLVGINNNKRFYSDIDKLSTLLMTRIIKIKYENNKKFDIYHFVEVAKYNNGTLTLKINPELKPFYLNLDWYTKYQLKNILQFKSTYSFRFYELLKQYQAIGVRKISVEDIRFKLDIKKDEYPKYANLKQKVILPAQKEINLKTDINFEFEEIKESRKIVAINFIIHSKELQAEIPEAKDNVDLIEMVKSIIHEDITDLEAAAILQAAKDNINIIKEKYEIAKASSNINNIISWMKDAIKNNYQMPKGKSIKTFSNYNQRSYDFDDLEKKLLGYDEVAIE